MFLRQIRIQNFKNHINFETTFSKNCNCVVGNNGSGKTSLLDAIHFLSLTKSSLLSQDAQSVQFGQTFFSIKGTFETANNKQNEVVCSYTQEDKKTLVVNGNKVNKLADHIGQYPLVLMAPTDTDLIRDGAETRRRFFDTELSQLDEAYLKSLIRYNKLLLQRNALLKRFFESQTTDFNLLATFTEPLVKEGIFIHKKRVAYLKQFLPMFAKAYAFLAEGKEEVEVLYESTLSEADFAQELANATNTDIAACRTTVGIHKDDFTFRINQLPVKKYGSQGQQKSFVMGLKLAQFELFLAEKNVKPLLLMDDIFDKLDEHRINKLIEMIDNEHFGQVFITDARPERSRQLLEPLGAKLRVIEL
jgi:DNA replication and repair protein RecF